MTVVGCKEGFDEVEGGPFGLPDLLDSPKGDPGEFGSLWPARFAGDGVHVGGRSPEDDRDFPHLDSDLLFGKPCVLGVVTGGPAWRVLLGGGIGLAVRSTEEQKRGLDVAYPERVGLVGSPALSNPSLDGCAGTHERRDLLAEDGQDLGNAENDLVQGGLWVLR